jgi:general secretion pathway protein K
MTRRRGFALLSALWFAVVIGGLGLHLATTSRLSRLSAANRLESAVARAAADAAVEHARAELNEFFRRVQSGGAANYQSLETALRAPRDTFAVASARYVVQLREPSAALHLNLATVDELRALMIALRIDAGRADRVAQAIADWRDTDDLAHPRGAERTTYLRANQRLEPRNAPFVRLSELRDVMGVDSSLFAILAPHVTLTGGGRINPNSAPEPVLLSVAGFSPQVVSEISRLRGSGIRIASAEQLLAALPTGWRNQLLDESAAWRGRLIFDARELEFVADAWLDGSPVRARSSGSFALINGQAIVTARRTE